MERLTFQLPLPSRSLSPNARGHWTAKAAAVREARANAREEGERVLADAGTPPPRWGKATIRSVWFLLPKNKEPDPDNCIASLKAYQDGLADAGIVVNDRNLWPERPQFVRVERLPRVEITITPEIPPDSK